MKKTDPVEREEVVKLIKNYYFAPFVNKKSYYQNRKLLLDNIILAIECMPGVERDSQKKHHI